jgi:hypothetical protein
LIVQPQIGLHLSTRIDWQLVEHVQKNALTVRFVHQIEWQRDVFVYKLAIEQSEQAFELPINTLLIDEVECERRLWSMSCVRDEQFVGAYVERGTCAHLIHTFRFAFGHWT